MEGRSAAPTPRKPPWPVEGCSAAEAGSSGSPAPFACVPENSQCLRNPPLIFFSIRKIMSCPFHINPKTTHISEIDVGSRCASAAAGTPRSEAPGAGARLEPALAAGPSPCCPGFADDWQGGERQAGFHQIPALMHCISEQGQPGACPCALRARGHQRDCPRHGQCPMGRGVRGCGAWGPGLEGVHSFKTVPGYGLHC